MPQKEAKIQVLPKKIEQTQISTNSTPLRNGKHSYIWENGDKYIGEWVNGKITGKGTMIWKNGSKYVGDFINGKMEGYGIYTNIRGQEFEGEFDNGNLIKKY